MMDDKNKDIKKAAIVGRPNTGKSHVFNNLTGEYTLVGNYPFTTVEFKRGIVDIGAFRYEIVDTPGIHSLYIHSEEELIIRNFILDETPDVLIQCIDANRLKQSLTLTADLLELGIPLVISLNAVDETTKKGTVIDAGVLSRELGVPVVESIATTGYGTDALKKVIGKAVKGKWEIRYGEILEESIDAIREILPEDVMYKRKLAVLLLLDDPFLKEFIENKYGKDISARLEKEVRLVKDQFRGEIGRVVSGKSHKWISSVIKNSVSKENNILSGFSEKVASSCRRPVTGVPILAGIVMTIFISVVNIANNIADWMNNTLWVPVETYIGGLGIGPFWRDLLIGDYGLLSFGISNAILTVLPILSVFFLLFNMLEDMGYIPNLGILLKRVFGKIGLSGGAIMPLTLAFGCKTMATLTTRSLKSKKERYICIFLIAFALPCSPQMALNMSILGRLGIKAFFIASGFLALIEILAGVIINKILKEEGSYGFMQELPKMRLPNPAAVIKKAYYRLRWFLVEAMPIFVIAAVSLFTADKIGFLGGLKTLVSPIVHDFLGFPIEMVDVLILCMARQEAAAAMIIRLVERGSLNYVQCIVAVTITTMFVPCLANIVAMMKELGAKAGLFMVAVINIVSVVMAGALNWVLINVFNL